MECEGLVLVTFVELTNGQDIQGVLARVATNYDFECLGIPLNKVAKLRTLGYALR